MKTFLKFSLLKIAASLLGLLPVQAQDTTMAALNPSFDTAEIQLSPAAEEYIRSVVDIMRENALHKQKLNFDHIQQAIRYYAHGAQKIEDTHEAIKKAIPLLEDHHSDFMTSTFVSNSLGLSKEDIETIKRGQAPHIEEHKLDSLKNVLDYASGEIKNDNIGYLLVPSFENLHYEAMAMFADSLQKIIKSFDQQTLSGWIVDLRMNSGGADMPMITGLGPLLDNNNVYYTIDEAGSVQDRSYYKEGGYYNIEEGEKPGPPTIQSTVNHQLKNNDLPVAILTSFRTASSGEAVTAIFAGQPNVKIIGSKTNGLTSVNNFIFLEDNSVLNLTIGYYANRHHELYKQGIDPDIPVKSKNQAEKKEGEDVVLKKAIAWIIK